MTDRQTDRCESLMSMWDPGCPCVSVLPGSFWPWSGPGLYEGSSSGRWCSDSAPRSPPGPEQLLIVVLYRLKILSLTDYIDWLIDRHGSYFQYLVASLTNQQCKTTTFIIDDKRNKSWYLKGQFTQNETWLWCESTGSLCCWVDVPHRAVRACGDVLLRQPVRTWAMSSLYRPLLSRTQDLGFRLVTSLTTLRTSVISLMGTICWFHRPILRLPTPSMADLTCVCLYAST